VHARSSPVFRRFIAYCAQGLCSCPCRLHLPTSDFPYVFPTGIQLLVFLFLSICRVVLTLADRLFAADCTIVELEGRSTHFAEATSRSKGERIRYILSPSYDCVLLACHSRTFALCVPSRRALPLCVHQAMSGALNNSPILCLMSEREIERERERVCVCVYVCVCMSVCVFVNTVVEHSRACIQ
jgi:hypothetical protein